MAVQKRRRSALETFDGCPYRFNVLYRLCRCGHDVDLHDQGAGRCLHGQAGPVRLCACDAFTAIEDRGNESQRGIAFHECAFRYIARLADAGLVADAEEASLAFQEGVALSQCPSHLVDEVRRLWVPFTEWFQLDLRAYMEAEQQQASVRCMACAWTGDDEDLDLSPSLLPACPICRSTNVAGFTWIPDLVYVRPYEVEIIDWKTYYKGLTLSQAEREFQRKFYLWQARRIWPNFDRYAFTFNFVRLKYAVRTEATPTEIDSWTDEVQGILLSMAEAERTGNFPALAGSHCGLCRLKCPIADNPYKLPSRIVSVGDRNEAAARLLVIDRERRLLAQALDKHCQTEGPFVFNGQQFGQREKVKTTYPLPGLVALADQHDIPLAGFLSKSGAAPLLKQLPVAAVQAIATKQTSWEFRHVKAGADPPAGAVDVLQVEGDDDAD